MVDTNCKAEKITDLCHGSEKNNNHSYTYIKNSQNVPHLEYSKYILELLKSIHLEKAKHIRNIALLKVVKEDI